MKIIHAILSFYYSLYRFSMPYTRNKDLFYIVVTPNKPQRYRTLAEKQDLQAFCEHMQKIGYHVQVRQHG